MATGIHCSEFDYEFGEVCDVADPIVVETINQVLQISIFSRFLNFFDSTLTGYGSFGHTVSDLSLYVLGIAVTIGILSYAIRSLLGGRFDLTGFAIIFAKIILVTFITTYSGSGDTFAGWHAQNGFPAWSAEVLDDVFSVFNHYDGGEGAKSINFTVEGMIANPDLLLTMGSLHASKIEIWSYNPLYIIFAFATVVLIYFGYFMLGALLTFHLLLFKFYSLFAALFVPFLLIPGFTDFGSKVFNNLIIFCLKLTLMAIFFFIISVLLDIILTEITLSSELTMLTMLKIAGLVMFLCFGAILLPGKLAVLFGGSIAFGDSAIASGLTSGAGILAKGTLAGAYVATKYGGGAALGIAVSGSGIGDKLVKAGEKAVSSNPVGLKGHLLRKAGEAVSENMSLSGMANRSTNALKHHLTEKASSRPGNLSQRISKDLATAGLGLSGIVNAARASVSNTENALGAQVEAADASNNSAS